MSNPARAQEALGRSVRPDSSIAIVQDPEWTLTEVGQIFGDR